MKLFRWYMAFSIIWCTLALSPSSAVASGARSMTVAGPRYTNGKLDGSTDRTGKFRSTREKNKVRNRRIRKLRFKNIFSKNIFSKKLLSNSPTHQQGRTKRLFFDTGRMLNPRFGFSGTYALTLFLGAASIYWVGIPASVTLLYGGGLILTTSVLQSGLWNLHPLHRDLSSKMKLSAPMSLADIKYGLFHLYSKVPRPEKPAGGFGPLSRENPML